MCIPTMIPVDVWQKPTQYCKAIKNKIFKKHMIISTDAEKLLTKFKPIYDFKRPSRKWA